jgi:DNA-binding winged helix-turn-helix (wHTH) protein
MRRGDGMADRDSPFERRINLAHEPPLSLGLVLVRPPTREVIGPSRRVVLEPRVMQVLIALAQAPNEIITRDELIMRCWHGTIVGESAVHRVISRLRLLAEELDGAFEIDTINKVGYRLRIAEPDTAPPPVSDRHIGRATRGPAPACPIRFLVVAPRCHGHLGRRRYDARDRWWIGAAPWLDNRQ